MCPCDHVRQGNFGATIVDIRHSDATVKVPLARIKGGESLKSPFTAARGGGQAAVGLSCQPESVRNPP